MRTVLSAEQRDVFIQELHERTTSPGFHFLSAEHLQELNGLVSDGAPVLSLYMTLDPEARSGDAWRITFKDLSRQALALADEQDADRAAVQAELNRIEAALEKRLPRTGRGLAFFACEGIGLFRQVGTALDLPTAVHLNNRPYVRPLARLRDEHDRFAIVLVSFAKTRYFFAQIGLVEEVLTLDGKEVETWDHASKDQRQDQREARKRDHAKRSAHALELMVKELGVRHTIYSVPTDMEAPFLDALDQATRQTIAASFACDTNATAVEVAERAAPVQRAVEAEEETATIAHIREQLTNRAVTGLDETLQMLNQQRVMTLVVDDAFRQPGGRGVETGMLTTLTEGDHPMTGEGIEPESDLVEVMLERALEQGASLELVRSDDARTALEPHGPVAALLRF
ncbi:MAG: peptide chain release factor 1 [Bacteroidota bacterium]